MTQNNARWSLFMRIMSLLSAIALPVFAWMAISIIELREFRASVQRSDPAIERRLCGVESEIRELRKDVIRLIAILELRLETDEAITR